MHNLFYMVNDGITVSLVSDHIMSNSFTVANVSRANITSFEVPCRLTPTDH